jgi:colanic acid/amylovoran biosynthesis glycosyltransferase
MFTVAYLANRFPVAVEPYVSDEIGELWRRGVHVIPGSVRRGNAELHNLDSVGFENEILCLQPIRILTLLRALALSARRCRRIACLLTPVLFRGNEPLKRRLKALLHTWLGAYYAVQLRERRVDHIHAHHGYFGSWIAMVAARLLDVSYSLTLHGSDLLVDGAYLDTKLRHCRFCATISEYNRRYILQHFPTVAPGKVSISRLGVDVPECSESPRRAAGCAGRAITLLAVGRLHTVKDHAFLVRACARLRNHGLNFDCAIAGDGPEREHLELLIREKQLQDSLTLLGPVIRSQMDALYRRADVVVLTSRSEGLPLVLMEAMVRSRVVLAPAITGIPEIVIHGKTGFLYTPGILNDFVEKILFLHKLMRAEDDFAVSPLDWIRHAARVQVHHNFNRAHNLARFSDRFLQMSAHPSSL